MIPVLTGPQLAWLAEAAKLRVRLEQQEAMRRNGGNARPNAELAELLNLLDTLAEQWRLVARGSAETHGAPVGERCSDEVDTATAGRLLGIGARQVRNLIASYEVPGRRTPHGWLLRRDDVLGLKEHRANQDQG